MKLNPVNLAAASALAFAVVWAACSALVAGLPGVADMAYRGMMHAGPGMPAMQMSGAGFAVGLVAWAVSAAITGGLIAVIYNAMSGTKSA